MNEEEEKKKTSFLLFYDWESLFSMLNPEDRGQLITALFAYEKREELPEPGALSPQALNLFTFLSKMLEENKKQWKMMSERGTKAGKASGEARRNKAEQDANKNEQELNKVEQDANKNEPKDKVKDKVKDKDNVSPNGDIESVGALSSKPTPARKIIPPKPEWVKGYFEAQGFTSDPLAFFDYWECRGWKTKTGIMKDWEAAARTWNRNEGQFSAPNIIQHYPISPNNEPEITNEELVRQVFAELEEGGAINGTDHNIYNNRNVFPSLSDTV